MFSCNSTVSIAFVIEDVIRSSSKSNPLTKWYITTVFLLLKKCACLLGFYDPISRKGPKDPAHCLVLGEVKEKDLSECRMGLRSQTPLVHRAQELTPGHSGKGREGQRYIPFPVSLTASPPAQVQLGIPMPSSALSWNRTNFWGLLLFQKPFTHLETEMLWTEKREGLIREAEPLQFTQLSKCLVKIFLTGVTTLLRRQRAPVFLLHPQRWLFKIRKNCCSCLPKHWTLIHTKNWYLRTLICS